MAYCAWTGGGQAISQVMTLTVTAVSVGGILTVTINSKNISYTCVTGDTTSTAAASLQALLSASTVPPEFTEIDFEVSAAVITATANSPGTPYTMTKSQSGGATCTLATTQVNVSPSDVINANNWVRNGIAQIPQNTDDVIIANSDVPLLWNLDQLASVLLNSWTRYQSFTGSIGLPENNPLGFVEYRPTYLKLASNLPTTNFPLLLGPGSGSGPTRERYDMQAYRTTLTALAAGSSADTYSVRFLGSHGNNIVNTTGVSVGCCMLPTETVPYGATIGMASVGQGGTLDCGIGCIFSGTSGGGTITINGGTCTLFNTPNVIATNGATVTLAAPNGTYTSVSAVSGVSITLASSMTISSLALNQSCTVDSSANPGLVTITSTAIDASTCQINNTNNSITFTNRPTYTGTIASGPILATGPGTLP